MLCWNCVVWIRQN